MNLFEISQDYKVLQEALESNDGLHNEETEKALEFLQDNISIKIQNCVNLIKNWNNDKECITKEIERLTKLKKTKTNAIANLKEYVLVSMNTAKYEKIDLGLDKVTIANNPGKLIIDSDELIPIEYIKTEVVSKVNTGGLKKYIEENGNIDGVRIVKSKSIRIK